MSFPRRLAIPEFPTTQLCLVHTSKLCIDYRAFTPSMQQSTLPVPTICTPMDLSSRRWTSFDGWDYNGMKQRLQKNIYIHNITTG